MRKMWPFRQVRAPENRAYERRDHTQKNAEDTALKPLS
jgi:hypothetical protein